jgi:ATP-dependent Lhr-like helicase
VLCQHILIRAPAGPSTADDLYDEVITTGAYADAQPRRRSTACLDFVATGGYALRAYDQWQRLMQRPDGLWQLRDPRAAQPHPDEHRHHRGRRQDGRPPA